jgi:Predicted hydrolases or acyltransferases (alpha/beta hydrolase superfamily)
MIKKNFAKKPVLITLLILSLPISAESLQDGLIDKLNSSITDIGFKKDHIISDDGVMINYYIKGSKKNALVFVHGYSCSSEYWWPQLEYFSKNYTTIAVDLAGHGKSGLNRKKYSMDAFGDDVKSVIEHLDLDQVVLIGHSMGGPVIVKAAGSLGAKSRLIIGVDTFHDLTTEGIGGFARIAVNTMFQLFYDSMTKDSIDDFFIDKTDKDLEDWIRNDALKSPKNISQGTLDALLTMNYPESLSELSIPMIALNARSFRETKLDSNFDTYKDIQIEFMEDVGHFIMLERPDEFNKWLEAKISE